MTKYRLAADATANDVDVKMFLRREDALEMFDRLQLNSLFSRGIAQDQRIMLVAHQGRIIARYGTRKRIQEVVQHHASRGSSHLNQIFFLHHQ